MPTIQIELRLAHQARPRLLEARNDDDIHAAVAPALPTIRSPEPSAHAKTINFGITTDHGLRPVARRIPDLDVKEAASLIEDYKTLSRIERFLKNASPRRSSMPQPTMLGRRRYIPETLRTAAAKPKANALPSTPWCMAAADSSNRYGQLAAARRRKASLKLCCKSTTSSCSRWPARGRGGPHREGRDGRLWSCTCR